MTTYWFSGDPVSGTGQLPSNFPMGNWSPQNVSILMSSGPFSLARGDTQHVVAVLTLGNGRDRLESISYLRYYSDLAQEAFKSDFREYVQVHEHEVSAGIPLRFELNQNYPNPFNPSTVIRYALPVSSEVLLEVFNQLGQRVMVVTEGELPAGFHTATIRSDGLASGIYFYRLMVSDFVATKKMLLIR